LGRNPGPIERQRTLPDEPLSPDIPPGIPSALLERRPDIRQAEQFLRSANAQVGVAVADFFPQLSLTALFGQVSPELSAFTSGGANAWVVASRNVPKSGPSRGAPPDGRVPVDERIGHPKQLSMARSESGAP